MTGSIQTSREITVGWTDLNFSFAEYYNMKMKDTMVLIVILCASVSMFSGCNDQNGERMSKNETSKAVYSKINAAQGKAMMDDGNLYTLIDVRTEQEYKAQHIKGAVLIPHTEMLNRAETGLPDKNARI